MGLNLWICLISSSATSIAASIVRDCRENLILWNPLLIEDTWNVTDFDLVCSLCIYVRKFMVFMSSCMWIWSSNSFLYFWNFKITKSITLTIVIERWKCYLFCKSLLPKKWEILEASVSKDFYQQSLGWYLKFLEHRELLFKLIPSFMLLPS